MTAEQTTDQAAQERRQKASSEVSHRTYTAVRAVATLLEDPAHITEQPIWKGATSTERRARPITQLQAAVWLRNAARIEAHRMIGKARGDGSSWEEIGTVLDVDGEHPYDRAVAAFEQAIAGQLSDQYFPFDCGTCDGRIKDYGPYESHPLDREEGHTATCARQTAAIAAWKEKHGDD